MLVFIHLNQFYLPKTLANETGINSILIYVENYMLYDAKNEVSVWVRICSYLPDINKSVSSHTGNYAVC